MLFLVWLLPHLGLCLVAAHGHAGVEGGHHLIPDSGARAAEVGHLVGLQVEPGEVLDVLQHLSWLPGLARLAGLARLVGFVGLIWLVAAATSTSIWLIWLVWFVGLNMRTAFKGHVHGFRPC